AQLPGRGRTLLPSQPPANSKEVQYCRIAPAWHASASRREMRKRRKGRMHAGANDGHDRLCQTGRRGGGDGRSRQAQACFGAARSLDPRHAVGRHSFATSLAFTGAVQTNVPLIGALIFPVGLISIVLLGLELVTGSFALAPLPWLGREASAPAVLVNWGWVFIGNPIGSVAYGALIAIALTNMGSTAPAGVAARIVQVAEAKTIGYSALGFAGMVTVFVKAILCNWMVCLAIVLAMTTNSVIGKIACAWMP